MSGRRAAARGHARGRKGDFDHQGIGWSLPKEGFDWMVAEKSDVLLNNPRLGGLVFLQLDVAPFCEAPTLPAQRLP